jgi:tRNA(Arg) A34 adenosine deaminase TadA
VSQSSDAKDAAFLRRAVDLSRERMRANLGGPFGAVIVRDGKVLAEGWNEVTSSNDPTAHAEVVAIRRACAAVEDFSLKGATIYASCEPCPMCLASIYWARIDRIVFANTRQEAAAIGFDDDFLYREIPKPLTERAIPTIALPLPEATEVFAEWMNKADKIEY